MIDNITLLLKGTANQRPFEELKPMVRLLILITLAQHTHQHVTMFALAVHQRYILKQQFAMSIERRNEHM
jgi:hypothetical protein